MNRWLDTLEHDLVVELSSSLTSRLGAAVTVRTTGDYFSYFEALRGDLDLAAAIPLVLLWSEIDLVKAFRNVSVDSGVMKPLELKVKPKLE